MPEKLSQFSFHPLSDNEEDGYAVTFVLTGVTDLAPYLDFIRGKGPLYQPQDFSSDQKAEKKVYPVRDQKTGTVSVVETPEKAQELIHKGADPVNVPATVTPSEDQKAAAELDRIQAALEGARDIPHPNTQPVHTTVKYEAVGPGDTRWGSPVVRVQRSARTPRAVAELQDGTRIKFHTQTMEVLATKEPPRKDPQPKVEGGPKEANGDATSPEGQSSAKMPQIMEGLQSRLSAKDFEKIQTLKSLKPALMILDRAVGRDSLQEAAHAYRPLIPAFSNVDERAFSTRVNRVIASLPVV